MEEVRQSVIDGRISVPSMQEQRSRAYRELRRLGLAGE